MRYLLLLIFFSCFISAYTQANEAWFQYHHSENTYTIDAKNIHPAAFFKHFSLNSGIEIVYEKNISSPIDYYSKNGNPAEIISYLKNEYSTLLTYKKSKEGKELLTSISILPKGQFQSGNMVMAVDPIEESINFKTHKLSSSSEPVYLTRLNHVESKVRASIERQADRTLVQREDRESRIQHQRKNRTAQNQKKLESLEFLKERDPALYAAQKLILNKK